MNLFHYTDKKGWDGIRASPDWLFRAAQPPMAEHHPKGANFTNLPENTRNLAKRLGFNKRKTAYVFSFADAGDLVPLDNDRGRCIFYSKSDYRVARSRQAEGYPRETGS